MAKKIWLTRGAVAIVDDADYDELMRYRWCLNAQGYAVRGYRKNGVKHMVRMHRAVIGDACAGLEVDHINGDKLDNRRCNLRVATRSENAVNRDSQPHSSKYRGVRKTKGRSMWTARICVNRKDIHLGQYKTEREAAKAYDDAATKYFGGFARLNSAREDFADGN